MRIQWIESMLLVATLAFSQNGIAAAGANPLVFQQANLTYDLTMVHDRRLVKQITAALGLGYQQASLGKKKIAAEINALRGNGQPRVIAFFSNEAEQSPGTVSTAAPASAVWTGPQGQNEMVSPPSMRTNLRIFIRPNQPYWYMFNSVWHELLHTTLRVTHTQTTPEGTMPANVVNDGVWYGLIKGIMLDFPVMTTDPNTGQPTELYNVENSPWS
jgi:hypothetical protein